MLKPMLNKKTKSATLLYLAIITTLSMALVAYGIRATYAWFGVSGVPISLSIGVWSTIPTPGALSTNGYGSQYLRGTELTIEYPFDDVVYAVEVSGGGKTVMLSADKFSQTIGESITVPSVNEALGLQAGEVTVGVRVKLEEDGAFGQSNAALVYLNGSGADKDHAVLIDNLNQFGKIPANATGYYLQTESFADASAHTAPVAAFAGSYDGNGKSIGGGDTATGIQAPLFDTIASGALVTNLYVTANINLPDTAYLGAVASTNSGTISLIETYGIVSGYSVVGGIVGESNADGIITQCGNNAEITASAYVATSYLSYGGGIAGIYRGDVLSECYNTGLISGNNATGGIIGQFAGSGPISYCYNLGGVVRLNSTGVQNLAGIVGLLGNIATPISDCYNTADICPTSRSGRVGGMIASNRNVTTENSSATNLTNCFAQTSSGVNNTLAQIGTSDFRNNPEELLSLLGEGMWYLDGVVKLAWQNGR